VPPPVVRLDEPEVDLDRGVEVVLERERVFVADPLLERELVPPLRDRVCEPPPPESPPESSSDASSFLPTPTAAAVASPTAAPVATFFGVDIPSDVSSSAMVSPLSRR
jgi:hypothetical protein